MASLNKVLVIGLAGGDAELKYTPQGTSVVNLRIAATERWNSKEGVKQERTEWFSATFWGKLAEIAGKYIKKGDQLYIEGRHRTKSWQDDKGETRYSSNIEVTELKLLSFRRDSASVPQGESSPSPATTATAPPPQAKPARQTESPAKAAAAPVSDDPNWDDIPF